MPAASSPSLTLWVVTKDPAAPHWSVLETLPRETHVVTSNLADVFAAAPPPDCILNGMAAGALLQQVWPAAEPTVRWVHSLSAGVEATLFPALRASPVPVTNGRGVFARSLGEYGLAAMLYFAKDVARLRRQQSEGRWEAFDVEELHGRTVGVIGYGEIGRAVAQRARPFGMRVIGVRRHPEQSAGDPLIDECLPMSAVRDVCAAADYVVIGAAQTPETIGLVGAAEIAAMKPGAVLINLARGPVVVEAELVNALRERRIKGAALDVFDVEPLPAGHPFYGLDNVLLSPHCADHTATWLQEAVEMFVDNFRRFAAGEPLRNVVKKDLGY